ncbi:MAG: YdcF family protein, partial [Alphaproteobacteria bacterium]|nr:YdcF family protein [Alphaproteobacteria bacterium]
SGVCAGLELEDIAKRDGFEIKDNMPVELGYEARDTVGNAKEIKLWAEKHGLKSVIGVTSSYHILRSRLEILHEMPEVSLEFAAVRSPYVKKDWWNSFESFKFLAAEYSKFLAVFVQYYVFRL